VSKKGIPEEMDGVDYLPEPSDPRMLSAVDPSIAGWQDQYRSQVVGWEPLPVPMTQAPRRVIHRTTGVWVVAIIVASLFVLWNTQSPITELSYPDSEWAWKDSGLRELQASNLSGNGVKVCIVDTGIDVKHPDLESTDLKFKDFVGQSTEPVDYGSSFHGTMMAGILVADGHIKGAAPNVSLSVAAALQSDNNGENTGDENVVAAAIEWCWEQQNADIISLSLGGDAMAGSQSTYSAVELALEKGVFVIAAAGNDGGEDDDGFVATPSNVPLAIAVGALDEEGKMWPSSSKGNQNLQQVTRKSPNQKPEIVAPGVEIISTGPSSSYYLSSGTSDATVFVTGVVALMIEKYPELRRANANGTSCIELVKHAIANSSDTVAGQQLPHDDWAGYGSLNSPNLLSEVGRTLPC